MTLLYIHHKVAQEVEYYSACEYNGDQDLSFAGGKDALVLTQVHNHAQGCLEADT